MARLIGKRFDMSETVIGVLLPAAIASMGYVAKLLTQEWREWRDRHAARLSSLLALQALLNASRAAFIVQNNLARKLTIKLRDSEHKEPADSAGFDALFAARRNTFTTDEADDHRVIRGYTEHALRPINARMSTWLRNDAEYRCYVSPRRQGRKSARGTTDPRARLAESLSALEAHLLLWHAKYAVWLPDGPPTPWCTATTRGSRAWASQSGSRPTCEQSSMPNPVACSTSAGASSPSSPTLARPPQVEFRLQRTSRLDWLAVHNQS
jgi:hypothetical protein